MSTLLSMLDSPKILLWSQRKKNKRKRIVLFFKSKKNLKLQLLQDLDCFALGILRQLTNIWCLIWIMKVNGSKLEQVLELEYVVQESMMIMTSPSLCCLIQSTKETRKSSKNVLSWDWVWLMLEGQGKIFKKYQFLKLLTPIYLWKKVLMLHFHLVSAL